MKPTIKTLQADLTASQEMNTRLFREVEAMARNHANEKKDWSAKQVSRELAMKEEITKSCCHMIDSLARMIGGPGF